MHHHPDRRKEKRDRKQRERMEKEGVFKKFTDAVYSFHGTIQLEIDQEQIHD